MHEWRWIMISGDWEDLNRSGPWANREKQTGLRGRWGVVTYSKKNGNKSMSYDSNVQGAEKGPKVWGVLGQRRGLQKRPAVRRFAKYYKLGHFVKSSFRNLGFILQRMNGLWRIWRRWMHSQSCVLGRWSFPTRGKGDLEQKKKSKGRIRRLL